MFSDKQNQVICNSTPAPQENKEVLEVGMKTHKTVTQIHIKKKITTKTQKINTCKCNCIDKYKSTYMFYV